MGADGCGRLRWVPLGPGVSRRVQADTGGYGWVGVGYRGARLGLCGFGWARVGAGGYEKGAGRGGVGECVRVGPSRDVSLGRVGHTFGRARVGGYEYVTGG